MKLYLVQHCAAKSKEDDPRKGLSDEGGIDAKNLASLLSDMKVKVSRVLHSGKLRAAQTAEVIRLDIAPELNLEERNGLSPMDSPVDIAVQVNEMEEDILIVSHLPFLSRFVSQLLTGNADQVKTAFRPGSAVCLERDEGGVWSLVWMIGPEITGL